MFCTATHMASFWVLLPTWNGHVASGHSCTCAAQLLAAAAPRSEFGFVVVSVTTQPTAIHQPIFESLLNGCKHTSWLCQLCSQCHSCSQCQLPPSHMHTHQPLFGFCTTSLDKSWCIWLLCHLQPLSAPCHSCSCQQCCKPLALSRAYYL